MATGGWLIAVTEARRLSRRPSMWAVRWGWVAVLVVVVGAVWLAALPEPRLNAGRLGHRLFAVYRDVALLVAAGLAPTLIALAASEDRTEGAAPLLSLAGLGSRQVLGSRVAVRLVAAGGALLGGLPVVALLATMGGVAPWAVVNATLNALGVMVATGLVAGTLAWRTGRVFLAVLLALTWGWLAFFVLPSLLEYALFSEVFLGWRGQGFLLRWLEVVSLFGFDLRPGTELISPVAAMRSEGPAGLLPLVAVAFVPWAASRARGAVGVAARVGALPLGAALWAWGLRLPESTARGVLWVGALALLVGGTAVVADAARWWSARDARAVASRGARHAVPSGAGALLWRDLSGGGGAAGAPWQFWIGGGWCALLLVAWWAAPASVARPADLGLGAAVWVVAMLAVAVAATAAIAAEIAGRTWPLLLLTRVGAARIIGAKLVVTAACALPLLVVGGLARGALLHALAAGAVVALACMASVLTVPKLPLAWILNLGGVSAWILLDANGPPGSPLAMLALAGALYLVAMWRVTRRGA